MWLFSNCAGSTLQSGGSQKVVLGNFPLCESFKMPHSSVLWLQSLPWVLDLLRKPISDFLVCTLQKAVETKQG